MRETTTVCFGDSSLEYTKLEVIGRGSFGLVWKASRKCTTGTDLTGENVAVKEMYLRSDEMDRLQADSTETSVLQRWKSLFDLKHPNVLRYHQITIERSSLGGTANLTMELMADGDLDHLIGQLRKGEGELTSNILLDMAEQSAFGLDYLHQNNIIHGDLKPANILIKPCARRQWTLLIADLDDRIQMEQNVTKSLDITQIRGTARYMSPEMVSRFVRQGEQKPGRKTDVWSLGCIILDLADCLYKGDQQRSFWKKRLFSKDSFTISPHTTREQIIFKIANGYIPVVSSEIPIDLADVIGRCLSTNVAERIPADALLVKLRSLLFKVSKIQPYYNAFLEIFSGSYDHLQNLDPVITWIPQSNIVAFIGKDSIFAKDYMTARQTWTELPRWKDKEIQHLTQYMKSMLKMEDDTYDRGRCFLASFNHSGALAALGFYTSDSMISSAIVEIWGHDEKAFVLLDGVDSESSLFNWCFQWDVTGCRFAAASCANDKRTTCLYIWTEKSRSDRSLQVVDANFAKTFIEDFIIEQLRWIDQSTVRLSDCNGVICDCAVAPSGILQSSYTAKLPLGRELINRLRSRHADDTELNLATRFSRAVQYNAKGNLMAEPLLDTSKRQASILRIWDVKSREIQVQIDAGLSWLYSTVDQSFWSESADTSIFCCCLQQDTTNEDSPNQHHLWMWRERRRIPALLSTDLAEFWAPLRSTYNRTSLSVSPNIQYCAAVVRLPAPAERDAAGLAVWDVETETLLWIVKLPSLDRSPGNPQWNSSSSGILLTKEKSALLLDLERCEQFTLSFMGRKPVASK